MRKTLVALGLSLAASAALAQPSHFDFVVLGGGALGDVGFVEAVREVPPPRYVHAFDPHSVEHTVQRPETVQEAVIRLEGGQLVTVTHDSDLPRIEPGQPVRVLLTTTGPLIEAR